MTFIVDVLAIVGLVVVVYAGFQVIAIAHWLSKGDQ